MSFSLGEKFYFKQYTYQEGLSQSWIRCTYQDKIGFVWFGTSDGLSRFDGHSFKIYRPKSKRGVELGNINVSGILQKNDTQLWIATDLGVFIYDLFKDELIPFDKIENNSVFDICKGKNGAIWFGTNRGLVEYDETDETIKSYNANNSGLTNSYINTLLFDSNNNLWVGTKNGVCMMLNDSDNFLCYTPSEIIHATSTNDVLALAEDHEARIWVGYAQDGLYCFVNEEEHQYSMHKAMLGRVISILCDSNNNLWVGRGSSEGLFLGKLSNYKMGELFELEHIVHDSRNRRSLSDNSIYSLYEDDAKDIWIGTFSNGVNYYSPRVKKINSVTDYSKIPIHNKIVNAITEDENYLYIGTEGGLDVYNKKTKRIVNYRNKEGNPYSLAGNPVYALHKDKQGNIWVGTWTGGLNRFDPSTGTFDRYMPESGNSISSPFVFAIDEDNLGNLWIGTIGGGLNKFNLSSKIFTHYSAPAINEHSVSGNRINDLCWTSNNLLLISSYDALDVYDYTSGKFKHFLHSYADTAETFGNIISIFEDSKHQIWLATNAGLELFDLENGVQQTFTIKDGLPDNVILSILEDNNGNLWLGTSRGLVKFEDGINVPSNPIFKHYTVSDGLSSNEFKKRAAFLSDNGTMYFGTSDGFSFFNPQDITENLLHPRVIIKSLQCLNSTSDENLTYNTVHFTANNQIVLSYKNVDFSIEYSALNYLNAEDNNFMYKMLGYDEKWVNAEGAKVATYTNLNPGEYTFMVKASNNDGIWNEDAEELKIVITPPWWETIPFRIFVVAFILSLIVIIFNVRIRMLKHQKKVLEFKVRERTKELMEMNNALEMNKEEITTQNQELSMYKDHLEHLVKERTLELLNAKEKAEESERLKSSFLSNMSHEIRTPMNAIIGFSNLLKDKSISEDHKDRYIEYITSNSKSLLLLIDDIIDISLIDADQIIISPVPFSIKNVLIELEKYYQLENTKPIEIYFDSNNDFIMNNDEVRFKQIFNNLITNALKYTHEGEIHFGYAIKEEEIVFYVSDTGIGIDEKYTEAIFNRFHKIEDDTSVLYRGAGIGLSINKKLVELLGGRIWVESKLGIGSTFFFTLPKQEVESLPEPEPDREPSFATNANSVKILVAEDELDNFKVIEIMLKRHNFELFWVKNGFEAVNFVKEFPSDEKLLILMDIKMPKMDGFRAFEIIKEINPNIPVIAVTAYALTTDRDKISSAGFTDFIAKPIKMNVLTDTIKKYMNLLNNRIG